MVRVLIWLGNTQWLRDVATSKGITAGKVKNEFMELAFLVIGDIFFSIWTLIAAKRAILEIGAPGNFQQIVLSQIIIRSPSVSSLKLSISHHENNEINNV